MDRGPHSKDHNRWIGKGGPEAVMVTVGQCGYVIWWYKVSKPNPEGGITSCWMCHKTLKDKK